MSFLTLRRGCHVKGLWGLHVPLEEGLVPDCLIFSLLTVGVGHRAG